MATYTKIILRRDTRANWAAVNPILSEGEIGVETDTRRFKVGLGNAHWNDLKYSTPKITGSTINENGELSLLYEDSDTPLAIGKVRGTSVSNQYVEYGVSDDNVTEPVSWQSTLPLVAKGKYLWTKTVTQYDDPNRDDTITYSYSRQGDDGRDGIDGNDGRSIRSILKTSLTPDENNDDTYTITYSDNTTETFKVHAGTNAEQYYIHYVYADNIGAGVTNETANYSKTETRKYIGVYVDKNAADAASYSEANGKSGIIWSQVTGTNGVSAYSLSLDNDFDTIPCNMYSAVTYTASDWLNQTGHTLTAFCGADRIEFKVVYQTLPTNATGYTVVYTPISIGYVLDTTNEAGNITTPVSALSAHLSSINANKGYVEYVLYKDRNKLASKTFEVSKLSAGADAVDYWLTADTQTIKINKEGQVSPATINVEFYKQVGQNDAELNLETKYRWYRIGERDATMQAATTTNGKAAISVPSDITAGLVIEFINNDGTIIYDRETIATAIDGIDGIDGDSFHMKANAEACTAIGDAYIGADKHIHVVKALEPTITFEDVGEIGGPQGERGNSYWLNVSSPIHTGTQQSEAITIDAMRKIGDSTEEPDTDAYIRYKFADETWSSKTNNGWVKTNSITLDSGFTDKDLVIEAAHKPASNYIKFDTETVTYSPKNTPVLDLSNDNDAIAYSESGRLDENASVSSTAHVYLNGADITNNCRISWAAATATISVSGATVTVSGLANYQEVITCTVDNIPDYSGLTLTKDFTVTKQVRGTSINNVAEFYLATNLDSGVTTSTSGWVETTAANATMPQIDANHPYLWNYERIGLSNNQFQTTAPVLVGTYSEDGQPGRGIVSITDYYYISSSTDSRTLPDKGNAAWKTTPDNVNSTDKYLWNYEVITYTTGDPSSSTPSIIGAYGDKGDDGDNGTSISGVEEYYLATSYATGVTAANGAWGTWQKDTVPAISESAQYLWNYEKIIGIDKDNQSVVINTTVPAIIGKWSQDGQDGRDGQNGRGIVSIVNYYKASSDGTTAPSLTPVWATSPADSSATLDATNKYLWNYEEITYDRESSTGANDTVQVSIPSIIGVFGKDGKDGLDGAQGPAGANGNDGKSITSNQDWYRLVADEATEVPELPTEDYIRDYMQGRLVVIRDPRRLTTDPEGHGIEVDDGNPDIYEGLGSSSETMSYENWVSNTSSTQSYGGSFTPVSQVAQIRMVRFNGTIYQVTADNFDSLVEMGALTPIMTRGSGDTNYSGEAVQAVTALDGWVPVPPEPKAGYKVYTFVQSIFNTFDEETFLAESEENATYHPLQTGDIVQGTQTTNNLYTIVQGKTTTYYGDNDPSNTYSMHDGDCWFKAITSSNGSEYNSEKTDENQGKLYQWSTEENSGNGGWVDIGSQIVANKINANFINALDITAKKIKILQTPSDTTSTLFEADGTGTSGHVKLAGWTATENSLYNTGNNTEITAPGGTIGGIWLSTGIQGTTTAQIGGTSADKNWFLAANDKFGVTTDGDIYTKDATINVQKLKIQRDSELATTTTGYKNAFKIDDTVPLIDIKNSGIRYVDITTQSITYTKKVICSLADVQIVAKNNINIDGQVVLTTDSAHSDYPYQLSTSTNSFTVIPNDNNKATISANSDPFRYFITFKLSDPVYVPVYMNFMLVAEPNSSFQGTATTADALWNENDMETAWISGGDIGAAWNAGGDLGAAWVAGGDVGAVWDAGGDIGAISDQPGTVVFAPGITEASVEIAHLGLDLAYLANIGAITGQEHSGSLSGVYLNIYITGLTASGWTLYDTGYDNSWAIKKECENKSNLSIKGNLIPDLAVKSGYLVPSSDYNLGVDNAPWERGFINILQSRAISVNKITNSTASETTIGSEAYPYTKAYIRELWVDEIHIKNSATTSTGTSAISSTNTRAWKGFETVSGRVVIDGNVMYVEPETYTENGVSSTSSDTGSSSGSSSGSGSGSTGGGSSTTPYIGGGGSGCFEAGTKITMADGSLKNIEDIKKGDKVLSYNVYTNTLSEQEVDMPVELVEPLDNVQLIFSDGTVLNTTMTHPFWTTDGWVSLKPNFDYNDFYKDLKEQFTEMMQVGQKFFKVKGRKHKLKKIKLLRIRYYHGRPADHKVYNLSISNYATFFANGILGHNLHSKQIMVTQWPVMP